MSCCLISIEVLTTEDYHFDDGISQNQNANGGQYVLKYVVGFSRHINSSGIDNLRTGHIQ